MTIPSNPSVMDKIIINVPGAPAAEIELKPGVNRLGRSLNTDFQIRHPSVSGAHCEIVAADGGWRVKDLGSTNGTLLDGTLVRESPWQLGQTLRLGEVEIVFAPENAAAPKPAPAGAAPPPRPAAPALASAGVSSPPPMPGATAFSTVARIRPGQARAAGPRRSFFAAIPGAFVFPFRRNGLILLSSGAVFFVIINLMSGAIGIVGTGVGAICSGYIFSFLKRIVTGTALGEEEMPDWPDYEGWMESGLSPFAQMAAVFLVCLGPGWCYTRFVSGYQEWLATTLWIGGLAYMPMALLAVAIYDNILALNPALVLLSILRVPLEYAAACLSLAVLALGLITAVLWLHGNVDVPVLAPIVAEFLLLYAMTVLMRVAGLLFYARKDRLNWKLGGK